MNEQEESYLEFRQGTGVFSTTLVKSFWTIQKTQNAIYDLTDAEYSNRLTLISSEWVWLNTKLGKRLGVHLLLFEKYTPEKAANSLKGASWQKLNKM